MKTIVLIVVIVSVDYYFELINFYYLAKGFLENISLSPLCSYGEVAQENFLSNTAETIVSCS